MVYVKVKKIRTKPCNFKQQFLIALSMISFVNLIISREAFENSISEFFIHSHKITSYQLSTPIINWQRANCTCTWLDAHFQTHFSKPLT